MTIVFKYTDETNSGVSVLSDGGQSQYIPRSHRLWREMGVKDAEEAGEILPFDYKEPVTLEEAYQAKYEEINAWRDAQEADESATVEAGGVTYDAGPASRSRIESYLTVGIAPEFWTSADNVDVTPFDLDMLKAIQAAILTRGFEIHSRQRALKIELDAMYATEGVTAEDLESLVVGFVEEAQEEETEATTEATPE